MDRDRICRDVIEGVAWPGPPASCLSTTTANSMTEAAGARGGDGEAATIRVDCPAPVELRIDPAQARLIVGNLLENALFYAPADSVIDAGVRRDGPWWAELRVRDRGSGVPGDQLSAIFRPFHRVDPSRARSSGGVGLGLALVREAALARGGSVLAANTDPGLEVTVRLPLAPTDAAE